MLPGETLQSGAPARCPTCKTDLVVGVQRSAGGWYIGTVCQCGPYTRESGYYRTEHDAQTALRLGLYSR